MCVLFFCVACFVQPSCTKCGVRPVSCPILLHAVVAALRIRLSGGIEKFECNRSSCAPQSGSSDHFTCLLPGVAAPASG
jgi:hypothetical protein